MTTALLISTYNWPDALKLVLLSVKQQSVLPNQVIIADDGSTKDTQKLINKFNTNFPVPIKHVWHKDVGFTKTVILNKAIKEITSEYIIQIDGDIILHKHFIKNHINYSQKNTYLYGSRVSLNETVSKKVLASKKINFNWLFSPGLLRRGRAIYFPMFNKFIKPESKNSRKLRGCNVSYWKKDAYSVNGYNEDFKGWGYEDFEYVQRLLHNGIKSKRIKQAAIQYHIYHQESPKGDTTIGDAILTRIIKNRVVKCKNGIQKLQI